MRRLNCIISPGRIQMSKIEMRAAFDHGIPAFYQRVDKKVNSPVYPAIITNSLYVKIKKKSSLSKKYNFFKEIK